MAAESESGRMRTYGNWRRPQSAGLGNLGALGTAAMLLGMIIMVILMAFFGLLAAVVWVIVGGTGLLLLVLRGQHNRSLLQVLSTRIGWIRTRAAGQHLYRSGPLGRTDWGTFQLPGLAAASRLSEHYDARSRPFALVHVPATNHYSVVFTADPDGASLVDQEQVDLWVAHWGEWLAQLGDEPGIEAVSVTIETAPDTGSRLRREIESNIDPNAPAVAQEMLREVAETYPAGTATIRALVALTFRGAPRGYAKSRDADEMARDLAARLPWLSETLKQAGAGNSRPVNARDLCELIRTAYEPAAGVLFEQARNEGVDVPLSWSDVGPTAHQAEWDCYRHDDAVSVTWAMTSAPRGEVQSGILHRLLVPHRDIDRKRVTLLFRPIGSARAARIVEQDKRNADFRVQSATRPSARALMDQRAAHATASEEATGAGLVNFGMLVTATVARGDGDRLQAARAAVEHLAPHARIILRPVYGSQDSAFLGALPLGLVMRSHLQVPNEVRESL